ncbi:MAG TPA: ABC transporter permease [Gemmatimonadales bacterium]|nr:ABC transporter permease [Gemmatimonadales bacterium]
MSAFGGFTRWLRGAFRTREIDAELEAEMALHLEMETAKHIADGMTPDEARRRARAAFGGMDAVREAHRDGRGLRWVRDFIADVRYALRALGRNPALAMTAIVTLALGIGATTAIFTAVNAVLLRPLPFAQPDELVAVWEQNADRGWYQADAAPANMLDWQEQVTGFADVAGYPSFFDQVTLGGDGDPLLLTAATVTGNFFRVLGVPAELGRTFTDRESWATGEAVAIISHRVWTDRFRSDPGIVGSSVSINRRPVVIVGVAPAGFDFPFDGTDIWMPWAMDPANRAQVFFRRAHWMRVIARLRPGISPEAANAELQTVAARLEQDYPATNIHMGAGLTPLHEFRSGSTRTPLLILLGAVAALLLIACANVGNLLLVQAASRDRETAVRIALGAGRMRLVRQGLTGSLVLSLLGGLGGLAVGWIGTRLLLALQPQGMLPVSDVGMDGRVLGATGLIALVSGILFGIPSALWGAARPPAQGLQVGGRSGGLSRRSRRLSDAVIVGEVALALLLALGAGLLTRSLLRLQQVEPGFDPTGVLATEFQLPESAYETRDAVLGFYRRLEEEARAIPGVQAAAIVSQLPLTGPSWSSDFSVRGGRSPSAGGTQVVHREISPDYLEVMRIPLVRGRGIEPADRPGTEQVVLINEALADRYFPDEDPVGLRVSFDRVPDSTSNWLTIVGIVGSERQAGLDREPMPEFLAPFAQDWRRGMTLVVRTTGDPASTAPAVRAVVKRLDPELAILRSRSMMNVRQSSIARPRFMMVLLLAFAGVGVLLAMVGVYGVISQLARRRSREMSLRLALGATREGVRWLVVRHGLWLAAIGVLVGTVMAVVATKALRSMLFGVDAVDPITFLVVPVLLTMTALVASWIPASRVARADPAVALQAE